MVAVEIVYDYAHRFPVYKAKAADCVHTVLGSIARMSCHNGVAAIHHVASAKQVGAAADFVAGVVVECTFQQ